MSSQNTLNQFGELGGQSTIEVINRQGKQKESKLSVTPTASTVLPFQRNNQNDLNIKKQNNRAAAQSVLMNTRDKTNMLQRMQSTKSPIRFGSSVLSISNSNVLRQQTNAANNLEDYFDTLPNDFTPFEQKDWKNREKNELECEVCLCNFKKSKTSRHHCRKCGKPVCDTCFKNSRRLSKKDSKEYKICDRCDFEICYPFFDEIIKEINELQKQTELQINQEISQFDLDIGESRQIRKDLEQKLDKKKQELIDIKEHYKKKKSTFRDLEREINHFADKSSNIKEQINKQKKMQKEQERRKNDFEEQIDNIKEQTEGYDRKFNDLIKEITKGNLPADLKDQLINDFENHQNSEFASFVERESIDPQFMERLNRGLESFVTDSQRLSTMSQPANNFRRMTIRNEIDDSTEVVLEEYKDDEDR